MATLVSSAVMPILVPGTSVVASVVRNGEPASTAGVTATRSEAGTSTALPSKLCGFVPLIFWVWSDIGM